MAVASPMSDFSWLQSLGYLKDENITEIWTKLQERQVPISEEAQSEAQKLRSCIRHIQEVIIPQLKQDKTLIIDNHLYESTHSLNVNILPHLLDTLWRVAPDLPFPETAVYVNAKPEIDHLPYLKEVKHLSIATAPEEAPGYDLFPLIIDAVCEKLESLRFNPTQYPSNIKEIARCPHLKKLSLISIQGISSDVFVSDPLAPQSTISELVLEHGFPSFSDEHWDLVAAALPHLKYLSIKVATKEEEIHLKKFLQYFPDITLALSIWHNDPEFIDVAAQYNLVSLSVTFDKAEDIKKLHQCSNLRQLYTAYLTDEGVENLIASIPELNSLRLYNCNIKEESFQALAKHFTSLEYLEIIKGGFNDASLMAFADECRKLQKVVVRECRQLTECGAEYFRHKTSAVNSCIFLQ